MLARAGRGDHTRGAARGHARRGDSTAWSLTVALMFIVDDRRRRLGSRCTTAGSLPPASRPMLPSALALAEIPPTVPAPVRGGRRAGTGWTGRSWRASGRVECDHGRDPAPSCTAAGRGQLRGRRRPDAVPGLDLGAVRRVTPKAPASPTAGTRRTRSTPPPTTCARRAHPQNYEAAIYAYNHAQLVRGQRSSPGPRATAALVPRERGRAEPAVPGAGEARTANPVQMGSEGGGRRRPGHRRRAY